MGIFRIVAAEQTLSNVRNDRESSRRPWSTRPRTLVLSGQFGRHRMGAWTPGRARLLARLPSSAGQFCAPKSRLDGSLALPGVRAPSAKMAWQLCFRLIHFLSRVCAVGCRPLPLMRRPQCTWNAASVDAAYNRTRALRSASHCYKFSGRALIYQ